MAATAFPAATEAAQWAFGAGGNAVDAAVAAAWALAVCEPSGSGLGGQTVALVRLASRRTVAVDGHSRAPAAVSAQSVSRAEQRQGYRACTVPTTPAALAHVQQRYGRLSLAQVLEPAIRLAEEGYRITPLQHRQLRWCEAALRGTPAASRFCLRNDRPHRAGDTFRQPQLAAALRRIAGQGVEDFYRGEIARAIVDDMRRHGGLLDAADLAQVGPPVEREPLSIRYRGRDVLTIPPPGGGVELLLGLRLLERIGPARAETTGDWHVRLAEVIYAAFAERDRRPAHPDDWTPALAAWLLGDQRVGVIAERLTSSPDGGRGVDREEPGETTHLCTADRQGNVVSLTQSIQSLFGAKVANARYGFLYSNYLATCPRLPHRYRLGSRCLARSNAAPALVLAPEAGTPVLALGAAGSRRIVSAMLHVLSGVLERRLSLADALAGPRVHARLSGRVWLERPAATPDACRALASRFRAVEIRPAHSCHMGAVQAIELRPDGTMTGMADPRRDGSALEPR
jgi:gamma-glutamyltranspeptidase/glutathione hydrolase